MNAPRPIALDGRESSDSYRGEIYRSGRWRIVACRDNFQWILQRHTRAGAPNGGRWVGEHYFWWRETAVRLWRAKTGEDGAILAALLPERIGREP